MTDQERALRRPLSLEALKSILHYDPATGVFTWLMAIAQRVKPGDTAGRPNKNGYVLFSIDGRRYPAHHLAWFYVHGAWPADKLDHRNLVRSDNWIDNLREADNSLNQQNTRVSSRNRSGFKGVCRVGNKWHAEIMVNRNPIRLGRFETPEAASAAYVEAKRKFHPFFIEGQGITR